MNFIEPVPPVLVAASPARFAIYARVRPGTKRFKVLINAAG